jgi:hypothetical protein
MSSAEDKRSVLQFGPPDFQWLQFPAGVSIQSDGKHLKVPVENIHVLKVVKDMLVTRRKEIIERGLCKHGDLMGSHAMMFSSKTADHRRQAREEHEATERGKEMKRLRHNRVAHNRKAAKEEELVASFTPQELETWNGLHTAKDRRDFARNRTLTVPSAPVNPPSTQESLPSAQRRGTLCTHDFNTINTL